MATDHINISETLRGDIKASCQRLGINLPVYVSALMTCYELDRQRMRIRIAQGRGTTVRVYNEDKIRIANLAQDQGCRLCDIMEGLYRTYRDDVVTTEIVQLCLTLREQKWHKMRMDAMKGHQRIMYFVTQFPERICKLLNKMVTDMDEIDEAHVAYWNKRLGDLVALTDEITDEATYTACKGRLRQFGFIDDPKQLRRVVENDTRRRMAEYGNTKQITGG